MAYIPQLTIEGIQEVQARNLRRIAALQPEGEAGAAVKDATIELHRYAVQITHVDTGAGKASHRIELDGLMGVVYLDPKARNPRSNNKVAEYMVYEHERGGEHAFYDRTVNEIGQKVRDQAASRIVEAVLYAK